jgi:RND family efflux transporter MFP subunit
MLKVATLLLLAAPRVVLTHAQLRPEERWVAGTVASARQAQIATRASAVVREVRVREGDRVAAGTVLVRLADGDLRAQENAARAAVDAARANEKRTRQLVAQKTLPPAQLEPAQAQLAQAEAQLDSAREALQYAGLRAPFAGVVLSKRVSAGDLVSPGQPLLELAGDALEIVASATEEEKRALRSGMRLRFTSGAVEGTAEVTAISPGGDALSHRGTLRALIRDGKGMRPGDFVRLQVPTPANAGRLIVPRTALVERGDLTGVFVVRGGRAQLRWLAVGDVEGGASGSAWVKAGLSADEAVIDRPGELRDGDPVEVADGR